MSERDVLNLALDDIERARIILDDKMKGRRGANESLAKLRHAVRELGAIVDEQPQ